MELVPSRNVNEGTIGQYSRSSRQVVPGEGGAALLVARRVS